MTGNKAYLVEYQDFNGGPVAFGELQHFNLFFVSQMCDKKNKVFFIDTEYLVLSPDFKFPDENQVLLRVPRQHNMYNFNLENIVPSGDLACLIAKATFDESNKWHRRLGHVNYKNLNKLVKGNLVRGLPSNIFKNDHTCVACHKGKQHKASFSTACYVLNRVFITKPHNKTPYELLTGKIPMISYIRPFGCNVTILNTIDNLGKFKEKSNEGFLVGYSLNSKDFRVYNLETKRVEENLHINFLENKPNVARKGPTWLFDLDYLTDSINYQPASTENKDNKTAGPKEATNSAVLNDGVFTSASYDAEVVVADFINLESFVNEELMRFKTQQVWILVDLAFGRKREDGIFVSQDKYVVEILKKFDFLSVKTASTPIETMKLLVKDTKVADVDVHLYRSMIGSLMYLTASRHDIMYAVCACSRFQVTLKTSHLQAVKRIFSCTSSRKERWKATASITWFVDFLSHIHPFRIQVKQKEDGIFISQDKYVAEILKKFGFMSVKTATTPIETKKPLVKDVKANDVDVHLYRSMIGFLMYLTASKPNIMYVVCACSRFQVTPMTSHLQAVKRIFRYLKGQPKLGEGADYAVNKGMSTNKIKVLNANTKGVSADGETLSTTTLADSTVSI
nr:ribonuclease H-like domain-containing protein [Tanacetum cinerariifolium]